MTTSNSNRKERIVFKKGIFTINMPFMLTAGVPWQNQVADEIKKIKDKYILRKSARIGYSITERGAEIKCYKN